MIDILASPRSPHQLETAQALKSGLKLHGVESKISQFSSQLKSKNVSCWGWRQGKFLREAGKNVLVMERSYIGDRFKYMSLGWNGLNGHAMFPQYTDDGGKRFKEIGGSIKPWKEGGKYIVILGQVKNDASLQGMDITDWYLNTAKEARQYGVPVYFRPHPDSARRGGYTHIHGIDNISGTLDEVLDGALFTAAFNSNSCLDSILMGVPCYAGDKGTMVYDLCMKDIGHIIMPEREHVLHSIAFTQWTTEEISQGLPIKGLLECGQY